MQEMLKQLDEIGDNREQRLEFAKKYAKTAEIVGGWEHYKGGLYWAVGLSFSVVDNEVLVLYRRFGEITLYARPLKQWTEITESGKPRFRRF